MGHAHAGHEHEADRGHGHGEAFPRAETSALVARELRGRRRRAWLQDGLIALALVFLALGLPLERLLGRHDWQLFAWSTRSDSGWVGRMLAADEERLRFLLAALCFGLGWIVLARAARRQGWEGAAVLRAGLVAASAPVVLFAATTPGPAAAGWLGACLVFVALLEDGARPPLRAGAWLVATLLHPWNAWLWPAWLARERSARGLAWCLASALGAGLVLLTRRVWTPSQLFAGFDGGPGPFVAWWTLWIAGLGGAGFGLVLLARAAAHPRPRTWWMALFALVPLLPLSLGGTIGWDVPWLWLAPLGWLGALELERRERGAIALSACALLFGAASLVWVRATDPEREWRARAEERLEPGDVLLTGSHEHHYLLGTRHGLRVWRLPVRWIEGPVTAGLEDVLRDARDGGRRLVLDEASLWRDGELQCDEATLHWARRAAQLVLPPQAASR